MVAQQPVHCAQAERRDVEAANALVHEVSGRTLPRPLREEEADWLVSEAAPGERQHESGRRIEPLEVVHRHQDGGIRGPCPKRGQHGDRDGALVGRRAGRAVEEERDAQRVGLGRRHGVEDVGQLGVEQVAETRERKPCLRLGRAGFEDVIAEHTRRLDAGPPESRLADARVSDEHDPSRAHVERRENFVELREFLVAADYVALGQCGHRPPPGAMLRP